MNIYQELHDDCGCYIPNNGYLEKWAKQGVLLLNTVLTVRAHQANSHRGDRLGAVYGCNHTGSQCTGPANRIYVVGKTGTEQDTDADKSEASDFKSATSKPTFCIQRFFWMQTFQSGK